MALDDKKSNPLASAIATLIRDPEIAAAIRDVLGVQANDALVDKTTAPSLGLTARAFEDAARANKFPAFKAGRKLVAYRTDVIAYLRSRAVRMKAPKTEVANDVAYDDLVNQFGKRSA